MSGRRLARMRQPSSPMRHADGPLRTFGLDLGRAQLVPPQPPGWSFLIGTRSGAALVRGAYGLAVATAQRAVWVPEGVRFALDIRARCQLRVLYLAPGFVAPRAFGVVAVTPLLRELSERAVAAGYLDPATPRDARLLAVFADELSALPDAPRPDALALPHDPRLRTALERVVRDPSGRHGVGELARVAHVSVRTFERGVRRETGVSPRAWMRAARLDAALLALATGSSVTDVALGCGYGSLSAFVSAFRCRFGATPGTMRGPRDRLTRDAPGNI